MTNIQIAELLRNVASAYQYKQSLASQGPGKSQNQYKFQIIAYNRAADSVEHSTSELKDLWDDGKLDDVPSIGSSIAKHLDEIFRTGKSSHFEELMKDIPKDAFTLMVLPKVGLKTAMKMIEELPKVELQEKIKEAQKMQDKVKRHLLSYAENIASSVVEWIQNEPSVEKIDVLGSLRRRVATVGDIDVAVATNKPKEVIERFVQYPNIQKVIEKGDVTSSILLPNNVQVDILVMNPQSYGNALQHFTGSKNHNIALREYSRKLGYSMSEHGIKDIKTGKLIGIKTEKELYEFLDLKYVEPELREGTGEIDASKKDNLPNLLTLGDIKADLQIHSDFDIETSHDLGINSMEEIIKRAKELDYEYIAFTEHNPSKKGHNDIQMLDILKRKKEYIEHLNYSHENNSEKRTFKVFNSLEIDMNKDGTLPVSESCLETLDFALVSIHSVFDMNRIDMTNRILNALSHPKVKIFAHPTGRKINEREGVEIDWDKVFSFCLENDKWIEINADPMRLDLPDILVRDAVKLGVKLTLGTDTHELGMMDNMKYGIDVARRGWTEKKDIVNTRSLKEFEQMLQ